MLQDFAFLGVSTRDYPEALVGKFAGKRLVICAGGKCVWDDLALLGVRGGSDNGGWDVMTVNDITMHYPGRIRHLYSNDHRMIPYWLGARRKQYERAYGPIEYVHTCRVGAKYCWPWPGHGTSALGAVYTGLAMGYDRIVLCGAPLDNTPNYFSPDWELRNFTNEVSVKADGEMQYWGAAAKKCFRGRVKSMSGRTRELLGAP
jgi:hypothetical protein